MRQSLFTSAIVLGLVSTPSLAQEATQGKQRGKAVAEAAAPSSDRSTAFHRDSEIRGLDLWSKPDTPGVEKADVGDIRDFVVDTKTGEISHVIISSGGIGAVGDTLRAIDWRKIQLSENEDGERVATVAMSEGAFDALPGLDEDAIDELTGPKAARKIAGRVQDAVDGVADDVEAAAGRAAISANAPRLLATQIVGLDLYGRAADDAFSEVGDLVLDCDRGRVAFFVTHANEESYLVPIELLDVREVPAEDGEEREEIEWAAHVPMNAAALQGAPAIDEEARLTARNPRFRAAVYRHFGVEAAAGGAAVEASAAKKGRIDQS